MKTRNQLWTLAAGWRMIIQEITMKLLEVGPMVRMGEAGRRIDFVVDHLSSLNFPGTPSVPATTGGVRCRARQAVEVRTHADPSPQATEAASWGFTGKQRPASSLPASQCLTSVLASLPLSFHLRCPKPAPPTYKVSQHFTPCLRLCSPENSLKL